MKIIAMEVGYIATNCYIVVNEETHHGVIIDPGEMQAALWKPCRKKTLPLTPYF